METSPRHRGGSHSLNAYLNGVHDQISVECDERVNAERIDQQLDRDDGLREADDDSDTGSQVSGVKATQTELSAIPRTVAIVKAMYTG